MYKTATLQIPVQFTEDENGWVEMILPDHETLSYHKNEIKLSNVQHVYEVGDTTNYGIIIAIDENFAIIKSSLIIFGKPVYNIIKLKDLNEAG